MVTILYSSDEAQSALQVAELVKKSGAGTLRLDFDAKEDTFDAFLMELDSFSLFDDKKILIVNNAEFLCARNTTKYDLDAILKRLPCQSDLVLITENKLDSRKKAVKAIKAMANVIELKPLTMKTQPDFVYAQLKKRHLVLERDALQYLLARIGLNPMVIVQELDKLSLYADHISLEDAKALLSVADMDDIFKMVDALFERNGLRLLALYRNFRKLNMEPIAIIVILAGQVRFLFQVKVLMDQGKNKFAIMKELGQKSQYRVEINMKKASRFSSMDLLEMLASLARLDQQMRMGFMDKDLGFEQYVMTYLR